MTPIPMAIKIRRTFIFSVAKIIVAASVNHRSVMVLIFRRRGIPSLDKYERIYGPKYLLLRSHLNRLYEEFM